MSDVTHQGHSRKATKPIKIQKMLPASFNISEAHLHTLGEYVFRNRHSRDLKAVIGYLEQQFYSPFKLPSSIETEANLISAALNISQQEIKSAYLYGAYPVLKLIKTALGSEELNRHPSPQFQSPKNSPTKDPSQNKQSTDLDVICYEQAAHLSRITRILQRICSCLGLKESIDSLVVIGHSMYEIQNSSAFSALEIDNLIHEFNMALGSLGQRMSMDNINLFEQANSQLPASLQSVWASRIAEVRGQHGMIMERSLNAQKELLLAGVQCLDTFKAARDSEFFRDNTHGILDFKLYLLELQKAQDIHDDINLIFRTKLGFCDTLQRLQDLQKIYLDNSQISDLSWDLFNFKLELFLTPKV